MTEKKFTIDFTGSISLSVKQIWPDGDAPENPTAKDVIEAMQGDCSSKSDLFSEWNFEDTLQITVVENSNWKDKASW